MKIQKERIQKSTENDNSKHIVDQSQPPKSRKCEKWDRTFSSTQILQDHIVVCQTEIYLWDICGKGFTVNQYKEENM